MHPTLNIPPLSAEHLRREKKMRNLTHRLPLSVRYFAYSRWLSHKPGFVPSKITDLGDRTKVEQLDLTFVLPGYAGKTQLRQILGGYLRALHEKYTCPGFVEIEPSDVVLDCGAFAGGFSMAAALQGARAYAIEPAPLNFSCVEQNLAAFETASALQIGLYNESQTLTFNISDETSQHSLLAPDNGVVAEAINIDVHRPDTLTETFGIAPPTFVKVEAEGVEPEIIEGLGEMQPAKIAVDISPERDGKSPIEEIEAMLKSRGYETRTKGIVLFARL